MDSFIFQLIAHISVANNDLQTFYNLISSNRTYYALLEPSLLDEFILLDTTYPNTLAKLAHLAIQYNCPPLFHFAVENRFDGWDSVLFDACRYGILPIAHLSVKMGANNYNQRLGIACLYNHFELVQYMIDVGAFYWIKLISTY